MDAIELDDLWREGKEVFTAEEETQLWNLLKVKLKRTLMVFHVLGYILFGAPARHSKDVTITYTSAVSTFDRAFQDFISCRKVYIHASPKPTRQDIDRIQAALSKYYEQHIGPLGARDSHRKRIQDHDAKICLLRDTLKESFRYMRQMGYRKVDFFRSMMLAADDALICLREVYWKTKTFLVGKAVSHDWMVDELIGLRLDEHLGDFLEEMYLVDSTGKLVCATLVDFPGT